ncbi:BTAD domain-containing putative transcriptional regulator [Streptomyces sp. NPDC006654]|uniref:BTAD domain-containing putative transcriptional regulator n=1 Tax=Streptomyces sp. NPDC006654 TaxID=3156897 RepID=UPI0033C9D214
MLCVQVLGPIGADIDGAPVHLGSPRQRAVLALLLAGRGRVVSVDRLVDRLWRGRPPRKAAASLHVYVSNLRRVLEPGRAPRTPAGVLVSVAPGYALRLPEEAVDAWRFEAAVRRARTAPPAEARRLLEEAMGWWHGTAYGEWADEEWAAEEAARLDDLHLTARELAIGAALASGAPAEAVPAAEALVREQPLREEGWRLLALGLWAGGRRAEALAELRRAATVMADELGLGLGEALTELERALLAGRTEVLRASVPSAAAPVPVVLPPPSSAVLSSSALRCAGAGSVDAVAPVDPVAPVAAPGPSVAPVAPVAPGPPVTGAGAEVAEAGGGGTVAVGGDGPVEELFVGRDEELRALAEVAREARRGGGVVLVTGEAGAGKSALLGRYRQWLREQGWTVVVGRCPEFDGAPSAWAWVEALGELARRVPPTDPDALGALLQEAGYGGPGAGGQGGTGVPVPDGGAASAGRFRLHRAFGAWLREAAADAPLAVLVDDLHRADGETLALLERAAELVGAPVLLIVAYRPADAADRLTKTLAELAHRSPCRLALGGLPLPDVATLVGAVCGEPVDAPIVGALAERTGGNPFYVRESARLLASEGALVAVSEVPQGVRDVLRRRLRQLPEGAPAVLQLASVVGRETEVGVLVEAADPARHGEPEVLDAIEAAVVAGLLTEPAPGVVRFAHALVRDTLYTDLVGVRRARLHARLAEVLRRRRPDDLAALAHHFARAANARTAALAVEYSLGAADLAERRYAHDTAVELLTQAIESFALIPADAHSHLGAGGHGGTDSHLGAGSRGGTDSHSGTDSHLGVGGRGGAGSHTDPGSHNGTGSHNGAGGRTGVEGGGGVGGGRAGRLVALLGRLLRAEIRAGAIVAARHTRQRALAAAEGVGHEELAAAALGAWISPEPVLSGSLSGSLSGPWGLVEPAALDAFVDRLIARADLDPAVLGALPAAPDGGTAGAGAARRQERAAEAARRLAVARAVGDPLLLSCALTVASGITPDGFPDRHEALATELRVLGYAHDLPANSWVREHIGAMAAGARNDVARVRRHTGEGRVVARRYRLVEAETINQTTLAMLAHVEGRFAESEAGYAQVRERLRSRGSPSADFVRVLGLTTVRLGRGRPREAEPLLRGLLAAPEPPEPTAELALGVVLARLGEHEEAYALGRRTEAAVPLVPDHLYGIALSLRAELAFLLGDVTTALELVPLLLPLRGQLAGAASVSFATRPFAHSLGELHRLLGDEAQARRQFGLAEDVARQWGSRHLVEAARAAAEDRPRRV